MDLQQWGRGMRAAPELLFWPGSLGSRGYAALLEAAVAGRFRHMAISPYMIGQLLGDGHSAKEVVDEARAHGVQLTHMDGVSSWAPLWYGADPMPHIKARFDFDARQCLDFAEACGLQSIVVAGAFDRGALPLDVLVESFGRFCDAAARRQMRVELEFVPFWGIPDLAAAWEIVRRAGRPNGGIVVDVWHLQKGSANFRQDLQLLAKIPASCIQDVQLADAAIQARSDSMYAEGRFRQFPGDGQLAIDRIVEILAAKGSLRWIGTEVAGSAIDTLSNTQAGVRCAAATQAVVQRLGQSSAGLESLRPGACVSMGY